MKLKKVRKQGKDGRDTMQLPYIYCFNLIYCAYWREMVLGMKEPPDYTIIDLVKYII